MKGLFSDAEAFAARRGRACLVFSTLGITMTISLLTRIIDGTAHRPLLVGWLAWQVVPLIWVFVGPGRLRRFGLSRFSERDMAVINDEVTRAHRAIAAQAGFALLLAGALVLALGALGWLALPGWAPLPVLAIGAYGAGLTFALLEIRAQRG